MVQVFCTLAPVAASLRQARHSEKRQSTDHHQVELIA
jgi:hypothetical protein